MLIDRCLHYNFCFYMIASKFSLMASLLSRTESKREWMNLFRFDSIRIFEDVDGERVVEEGRIDFDSYVV